MNAEDRETPADEISTQGIKIFYTKTDTKSHSILELWICIFTDRECKKLYEEHGCGPLSSYRVEYPV